MSGVDPLARTLARASTEALTLGRTVAALRRSIARGRLPQVMANPPTVADGGYSATPAGWTEWSPDQHADRYTLLGGNWTALGTGYPFYFVFSGFNTHYGDGTEPTANHFANVGPRIRFASFAPVLDIGWSDTGGQPRYRLKVDGAYVKAGVVAQTGFGYVRITWGDGSDANRTLRHYELECLETRFMGVRTPTATPPFPWPVEDCLRMVVHGDSMVSTVVDTTAPTTQLHGATHDVIANLCGQPDCWNVSIGGTGWIANTGGAYNRFNEHVTDVIAAAPDVIWEMGGRNDTSAPGMTQAGEQVMVEQWLQQVTAALPDVLILMTGPIASRSAENLSATFLQVAAAKQAAAARYPRNVRYFDNLGGPAPWMSGTGTQGAPAGDGPADWAIGGDGVHPTAGGHVLQGRRFVSAAAAVL